MDTASHSTRIPCRYVRMSQHPSWQHQWYIVLLLVLSVLLHHSAVDGIQVEADRMVTILLILLLILLVDVSMVCRDTSMPPASP